MIDLYYFPTPNTWKISIFLEETGLAYRIMMVNILEGEQFEPDFQKISPNGRIPAIVDHDCCDENGQPLTIMESGAILIHLAEKTGRFYPQDPVRRAKVLEWLMWQMSGVGPMVWPGQPLQCLLSRGFALCKAAVCQRSGQALEGAG